jgi:hypothetical protein
MDMVYSAADYRVWRVWCSIVETESVANWQQFHVLGEYMPAAGIVLSAATAVGMNLTCIENHGRISGDVLRLLPTSKTVIHTEGVTTYLHFNGNGRLYYG